MAAILPKEVAYSEPRLQPPPGFKDTTVPGIFSPDTPFSHRNNSPGWIAAPGMQGVKVQPATQRLLTAESLAELMGGPDIQPPPAGQNMPGPPNAYDQNNPLPPPGYPQPLPSPAPTPHRIGGAAVVVSHLFSSPLVPARAVGSGRAGAAACGETLREICRFERHLPVSAPLAGRPARTTVPLAPSTERE